LDEPELSKTRRKKDMHALQDLGEKLVELTSAQLANLELPERLADAIEQAKRVPGFEARRRQMQYIGRLMRAVDAAPIAARIAAQQMSRQRENARHKDAERWRDRLLADESALTELTRAHPGLDTQQLRTLIRNVRKEQAQGRPPHAARALFRALRTLIDSTTQNTPADSPGE
jgi:ribosome-associated protein